MRSLDSSPVVVSVVAGTACALFWVSVAAVLLDVYVTLTVSVGHGGLIAHLTDAAVFLTGASAFTSGAVPAFLVAWRPGVAPGTRGDNGRV